MYIKTNRQHDTLITEYEMFMQKSINALFKNINTAYKQKKAFLENFEVVLPEKVHIGSTIGAPNYENEMVLTETIHLAYYVPFIPSLRKLLKTLPTKLLDPTPNRVIKTNVFDGDKIKEKMKRKNTLAIVLYLDDMEFVNIAGSGTTIHKQSYYIFFRPLEIN